MSNGRGPRTTELVNAGDLLYCSFMRYLELKMKKDANIASGIFENSELDSEIDFLNRFDLCVHTFCQKMADDYPYSYVQRRVPNTDGLEQTSTSGNTIGNKLWPSPTDVKGKYERSKDVKGV